MFRVSLLADAVPQAARMQIRHRQVAGTFMHVSRAQTYTEKLYWRHRCDRRPLLAPTCDKLRMKARATELVSRLGVGIPRTLWVGDDVVGCRLDDSVGEWVLKPNDGMNSQVVFGAGSPDVRMLERLGSDWQRRARRARFRGRPWAYGEARPLVLAEEKIVTQSGQLDDIKVHMFDGKPALIQYIAGRWAPEGVGQVLLTPDWREVSATILARRTAVPARPAALELLLEACALLAEGFDYMRIDMYEADGRLWFGEYTPYPNYARFMPDRELDQWLGRRWALPGTLRGGATDG
jgi:hypothetical protein